MKIYNSAFSIIGNNIETNFCHYFANKGITYSDGQIDSVTIGKNAIDCSYMFNDNGAYYVKNVDKIPPNVINCVSMFKGTRLGSSGFGPVNNETIVIPDKVENCSLMFQSCIYLNRKIVIGKNVNNCYMMFQGCANFNQPVTIPDSVTTCSFMFGQCVNFNQPVVIGNNVTNCNQMFIYCANFNQPITIPDSVTDCTSMFRYCNNFNKPITIYAINNAKNISGMLYINTWYNYSSNIYIYGNNRGIITYNFITNNRNTSRRINIHFNSILNSCFNISSKYQSIVYDQITWTTMTNGFYNATYNIYCYNNLPLPT